MKESSTMTWNYELISTKNISNALTVCMFDYTSDDSMLQPGYKQQNVIRYRE